MMFDAFMPRLCVYDNAEAVEVHISRIYMAYSQHSQTGKLREHNLDTYRVCKHISGSYPHTSIKAARLKNSTKNLAKSLPKTNMVETHLGALHGSPHFTGRREFMFNKLFN